MHVRVYTQVYVCMHVYVSKHVCAHTVYATCYQQIKNKTPDMRELAGRILGRTPPLPALFARRRCMLIAMEPRTHLQRLRLNAHDCT